jgi:hypothetical protein
MPALTSGIYAYHDVITSNTSPDEAFQDKWDDLMGVPVKDRIPDARNTGDLKIHEIPASQMIAGDTGQLLKQHVIWNSLGLGGVFLVVVAFIGCSDRWRKKLYVPLLILLIASQGAIIWGSHDGGLIVYQQGAVVQPLVKSTGSDMKPTFEETLMRYLPPAQLHFTMAGVVIGLALVALGLSIRAMTVGELAGEPTATEDWFESKNERLASPMTGTPATAVQASADRAEGIVDRDLAELRRTDPAYRPAFPVPAARFWLLTLLTAIITFAAGLWLIRIWTWKAFVDEFHGENRDRYHIILGTSIVALTLILAFLARFARRAKWALGVFAFLLLAAVGLQIYIGVLMTFDGPKGPTNKSTFKNITAPLHWWPHEANAD